MAREVAIVGAGVIGCAIARELAARGVRCTVLDARAVAGGATQASAGMLAPYVEAHEGGPLLELGIQSLALYDDWIGTLRSEGRAVEYRSVGTLQIALTGDGAAALRDVPGTWVDASELARTVPDLAAAHGAVRNGAHGYVDAAGLARALAGSAERHGARFLRTRVQRLASGGRLTMVCDDREVDADGVVLAAGAWTNSIAGLATPPLRPVRGQLLHVRWDGAPVPAILWGPDCYIVPRTDGTLLVGATVEEVGFDERTTAEGIAGLLDAARSLLPRLSAGSVIEARAGLRPATPDNLPVIGRDPAVPAVIHASGHYRNGVLLAPITAKAVADLVVGGETTIDLSPFRPERFL
jgi:glycine oxidase